MRNLLVMLFALGSLQSAVACSCLSNGNNLCESFRNDTFVKLVCLVKKVDTMAYGFKVQRLYNFYGTETRDTFWVWGDNGALCRLYDGWQIGDSLVLSLQVCDTAGNFIYNPDYPPNLESANDYQVSGCGAYAAYVEDGIVKGYLDEDNLQEIPLSTYIASHCFGRQVNGLGDNENPIARVRVHTATRQILATPTQPGTYTSHIYNSAGQLLKTTVLTAGPNWIDAADLPMGTFIFTVTNGTSNYSTTFIFNN